MNWNQESLKKWASIKFNLISITQYLLTINNPLQTYDIFLSKSYHFPSVLIFILYKNNWCVIKNRLLIREFFSVSKLTFFRHPFSLAHGTNRTELKMLCRITDIYLFVMQTDWFRYLITWHIVCTTCYIRYWPWKCMPSSKHNRHNLFTNYSLLWANV